MCPEELWDTPQGVHVQCLAICISQDGEWESQFLTDQEQTEACKGPRCGQGDAGSPPSPWSGLPLQCRDEATVTQS